MDARASQPVQPRFQHGDPRMARDVADDTGMDSWSQVVPPSRSLPRSPKLSEDPKPVAEGANLDRSRPSASPLSPSASALMKLTAPDEEPLTDPRLASINRMQNKLGHSSAIKQEKKPTWYRRVSVPRPEACSEKHIKMLELQLEIAKEKNKGRSWLTPEYCRHSAISLPTLQSRPQLPSTPVRRRVASISLREKNNPNRDPAPELR